MASLTPGVLTKLLDNVGNKDAKVKGEHRTALLQVIEIIPSLALGDDPWQSKGYFLKVSDSMHCAYVSMCQDDLDLIYTDKIKLGQFVYVGWLGSGSPVPVLRGLKPVSRRRPCVGSPKDLMSSDLLQIKGNNVGFVKDGCKGVSKDVKLMGKRKEFVGKVEVKLQNFEPRRLSLDSARRAWDDKALTPRKTAARVKSKNGSTSSDFSPIQSGRKFSSKDDALLKCSVVAVSLKNKNGITSPRLASKSSEPDSISSSKSIITASESLENLRKVPLRFRKWCDQGISWDALPSSVRGLGKGTVHHRNTAFLAAVQALEEASATEAVIHCMSAFAELCQSSQIIPVQSLLQQFLDLHQRMQVAAGAVKTLIDSRSTQPKPSTNSCQKSRSSTTDVSKIVKNRNAVSWILAAMESDLSNFSLYSSQEENEIKKTIKQHYVIIESTSQESSDNHSTKDKKITTKHKNATSDLVVKRVSSPFKPKSPVLAKSNDKEWSLGAGLKETACLAEKLFVTSSDWFLKYLDDSLKHGFGLKQKDSGRELAELLGQLKRVDQWLDTSVQDAAEAEGRRDELKKKLYGFLLEHVNSAFATK